MGNNEILFLYYLNLLAASPKQKSDKAKQSLLVEAVAVAVEAVEEYRVDDSSSEREGEE